MTGKDRRWPHRAERQQPGHDHAHERGNGHSHGLSTAADRRYLVITLCLLGAFMLGEIIVAFATGSLALVSDAGHMLSEVGAIAGALWATRLAAQRPDSAWELLRDSGRVLLEGRTQSHEPAVLTAKATIVRAAASRPGLRGGTEDST